MRPTTITGTPTTRFTAAAAARLCASPKLEPVTICVVSGSITPPLTCSASTPAATSSGAMRCVSSSERPPGTRS